MPGGPKAGFLNETGAQDLFYILRHPAPVLEIAEHSRCASMSRIPKVLRVDRLNKNTHISQNLLSYACSVFVSLFGISAAPEATGMRILSEPARLRPQSLQGAMGCLGWSEIMAL